MHTCICIRNLCHVVFSTYMYVLVTNYMYITSGPSHLCVDIAGLLKIETEGWWRRNEARVCVERIRADSGQ